MTDFIHGDGELRYNGKLYSPMRKARSLHPGSVKQEDVTRWTLFPFSFPLLYYLLPHAHSLGPFAMLSSM